ncbi:MAG: SDR family NAD(P)-dependent oxidoreductase, partial [Pseudomonadota bacterium]
ELARLDGKVAIVTGAAGGIGLATASLFAGEGAKVVLSDIDEARLQAASEQIGDAAVFQRADVAKEAEVQALVDLAVSRFGGLDIAVLNAGMFGTLSGVLDYPEETFDKVIDVNLKGVWHGLRTAAVAMRARGAGSIVITSSTQGLSGYYNSSPYTASKHAVVGIMRNAAVELARDNIRVNTVHPGFVDTDMMGSLHSSANPEDPASVMASFEGAPPIGRYAKPSEIAPMMLFLASDEASYCTGSCFVVDGGLLAYHGGPAPE